MVVALVVVFTVETVGLRSDEQYCEACDSSVGLLARSVDCEEQKGTDGACFVTTHLQSVSNCLAEYSANGEVVLGLKTCQCFDHFQSVSSHTMHCRRCKSSRAR